MNGWVIRWGRECASLEAGFESIASLFLNNVLLYLTKFSDQVTAKLLVFNAALDHPFGQVFHPHAGHFQPYSACLP